MELIKESEKLGPIEGIFNTALVMRDSLFENQTQMAFEEVVACKGRAMKFMDEISRERSPHLRYFVAFSSITSGIGNVGISAYGWGNSMMETIIEKRSTNGLPGKAIQVISRTIDQDFNCDPNFSGE